MPNSLHIHKDAIFEHIRTVVLEYLPKRYKPELEVYLSTNMADGYAYYTNYLKWIK